MPKPKVDAEAFFRRLAAANPDPRGELEYINPYTLLVAVVLSAQATDVSVNKATEPLFKIADTPAKMLALGEARLKEYIRTIGLYNTKAKNIIRLSELLRRDHGGRVPQEREALQALPGVGRKTANVVLNVAFGQPTMAVDTHIFRLCNRSGLAPGKTADAGGRGRADADEAGARAIPAQRPSLADPARPLRLQGAQTRLHRMRGARP